MKNNLKYLKKRYVLVLFLFIVILSLCVRGIVLFSRNSIKLINCKECVFAFYEKHRYFGDTLENYTKDIKSLKDEKGDQRNRFMGHILSKDGKIKRAFVCGIENRKVFCLEGTLDGKKYKSNKHVLNKVFKKKNCTEDELKYICTGNIKGSIRKDGYVSIIDGHNCHIMGETGEMYCY